MMRRSTKYLECPFLPPFDWDPDQHITREEMEKMQYDKSVDQDSLGDRVWEKLKAAKQTRLFPWLMDEPELKLLSEIPPWVDWDLIEHGQKLFQNYMGAHQLALIYTLLGGFSVPEINKVLMESRYWIDKGDAGIHDTKYRLRETWMWYREVMSESMRPGGNGWKAVLDIRMLHSRLRTRLRKSAEEQGIHGEPPAIHQLHLLATLSGFQYNFIRFSEERLKINFTEDQKEGWTMLWRWIGHCLGIQREPLEWFSSFNRSEIWWQSMTKALLLPDQTTRKMTDYIMTAIVYTSPIFQIIPNRIQFFHSVFRVLMGPELGDILDYKSHWLHELQARVVIVIYIIHYKYWAVVERIPVVREIARFVWLCYIRSIWAFLRFWMWCRGKKRRSVAWPPVKGFHGYGGSPTDKKCPFAPTDSGSTKKKHPLTKRGTKGSLTYNFVLGELRNYT